MWFDYEPARVGSWTTLVRSEQWPQNITQLAGGSFPGISNSLLDHWFFNVSRGFGKLIINIFDYGVQRPGTYIQITSASLYPLFNNLCFTIDFCPDYSVGMGDVIDIVLICIRYSQDCGIKSVVLRSFSADVVAVLTSCFISAFFNNAI